MLNTMKSVWISWLGALLSLSLVAFFLGTMPHVLHAKGGLLVAWPWVPSLGVEFSFLLDGLSLLFALIISGIGTLIFTYGSGYFKEFPSANRVFLILIAFMVAMLGLVLADNILTMFVFWELTTITSFLLIGTNHEKPEVRHYAMQALLITVAGGLAFLAGLVLLGNAAGSYSLSEITAQDLSGHSLYLPVFILVFIGCMTKSALFPFHFWLPNAMAAPTPISAFLHSATMVKAGLYILARLHPSLSGTEVWFWSLTVFGTVTAAWGSVMALKQTDMKLMLAYTTLMALGTITLFLAGDGRYALMGAMVFLLVHALYKAALFMVIGNIEKAGGTRDWRKVSGLKNLSPTTAVVALLAGLSMVGLPPFFGFLGKELLIEGAMHLNQARWFVVGGVLLASVAMVAVGLMIVTKPFWGQLRFEAKYKAKQLSWVFVLPPLVLGVLGLLFGLMPEGTVTPLLQIATAEISGSSDEVALKLWHGFNAVLAFSVMVVFLGALAAWKFAWVHQTVHKFTNTAPITGESAYNIILKGLLGFARWQDGILQNGRQRFYLSVVFLTLSSGIWFMFWLRPFMNVAQLQWPVEAPLYVWVLACVLTASVLVTVFSSSRMLAISALGVGGTTIALLFVVFSAPDVAMTQFMVEILLVIILTLVVLKLPTYRKPEKTMPWGRWRDGAVAVLTGTGVTAVMLSIVHAPFDDAISQFYGLASYTEAHGRNIVNVILVDFRAIDTMGEILVVSLAGLACYGLIKLRKEQHNPKTEQRNRL